MAKRKRLTPAEPNRADTLSTVAPSVEAKAALPIGVGSVRSRPPISQVAGDAAAAAALEDMAQQMRQARASGRLIQTIPEAQIDISYLVRDRIFQHDDDMYALMQSLQARGQQTPVELVELESGGYGLISGWRRLTAVRQLRAETGEPRFDTVLAILRRPETAADAYLAMIEENEIRVGLSYYERARIAAKAVEQGVYPDEKKALLSLFSAASRAKRSKIRSFLSIYHALDQELCFAGALPERLGLRLSKALQTDEKLAARLKAQIIATSPRSAEAEQSCIVEGLNETRRSAAAPSPETLVELSAQARSADVNLTWSGRDLVLSGKGVTPSLAEKLQTWLGAGGRQLK